MGQPGENAMRGALPRDPRLWWFVAFGLVALLCVVVVYIGISA